MSPGTYSKRVLVCVTGMSPQIVTETVFALTQMGVAGEPFVPTAVHLISTQRGAENARLKLLSEQPGWFARLLQEWQIPPIEFSVDQIHVIQRDDGSVLDDIRDDEDNRLAADFIAETVRELTSQDDCAVHASMAGGRKTMGFYLGYAMSLYGRSQDRLSHVLVSPPFESHPEFYFPTRTTRVITAMDRAGEALDCSSANVYLGDIPFVRLRDGMPHRLLHGRARFSEAIVEAQRALGTPSLRLNIDAQTVEAHGEVLTLPPLEFALYWEYAERCLHQRSGVHWSEHGFAEAVLRKHRRLVGEHSGEAERTESAWRRLSKETVDPMHSRLRKRLLQALGERRAAAYLPAKLGLVAGTRYQTLGLTLHPSTVSIVSASLPETR